MNELLLRSLGPLEPWEGGVPGKKSTRVQVDQGQQQCGALFEAQDWWSLDDPRRAKATLAESARKVGPGCSEEAAEDLKFKVGRHEKKTCSSIAFFSRNLIQIIFILAFTLNLLVGHVED